MATYESYAVHYVAQEAVAYRLRRCTDQRYN